MTFHKLSSTDAFVVIDLDAGDESVPAVGVVRSAPKILRSGAEEMARSLTYTFAVLEQQRSGASAGINAAPDDRDEAVAAFVAEVTPMVEAGTFLPDAAKGVDAAALAPLAALDSRSSLRLESVDGVTLADRLTAVGAVAAASAAAGGDLSGRTVAVEGFDAYGPTLMALLTEAGAKVTAVGTKAGTALDADGLDTDAVTAAWYSGGDDLVTQFGDVEPAWKIFGAPVDVLLCGSKMGTLSHKGAEFVKASVVVPTAPIPVTTKAFAMLRRAGVTVVPDFVSTAGPVFSWWPPAGATAAAVEAEAAATIGALVTELCAHDDGPLMAGCYKAEAFLSTWRPSLPFGRPLAA